MWVGVGWCDRRNSWRREKSKTTILKHLNSFKSAATTFIASKSWFFGYCFCRVGLFLLDHIPGANLKWLWIQAV